MKPPVLPEYQQPPQPTAPGRRKFPGKAWTTVTISSPLVVGMLYAIFGTGGFSHDAYSAPTVGFIERFVIAGVISTPFLFVGSTLGYALYAFFKR